MQVDEKRACTSCRAENPTDARFCWQCYTSFAEMPAPPSAADQRPVGAPVGPLGAARTYGAAGPVPPPPAVPLGPEPAASAPPASGSGLVLRVVVGAVAAVLGYVLVASVTGGGVSIPDSLGGLPRQTNATAQDFESEMQAEGDRWDLEVHAATYGRSSFPETMLILVEGSALETTDELFDALVEGMAAAGASIDSGQAVSGTDAGADYRCIPVVGTAVDGSACIWHADDHVGIVMGLGGGGGSAEALIAEAHAAVTA
jgi:hypothetical protein